MRRTPTMAERLLWKLLRDRRLEGLKFRRQTPVGPFVADFLCLRHRLIVEADGPWHIAEADAARDAWLGSQGFRVLRFSVNEIVTTPENVLMAIMDAVQPSGAETPVRPLIRPR
jgi:very-short-patch-repair endonuclease